MLETLKTASGAALTIPEVIGTIVVRQVSGLVTPGLVTFPGSQSPVASRRGIQSHTVAGPRRRLTDFPVLTAATMNDRDLGVNHRRPSPSIVDRPPSAW